MDSIVETMMKQLLSKEILYEPMKDIVEKYPKWLEDNKSKISKENMNVTAVSLNTCWNLMRSMNMSLRIWSCKTCKNVVSPPVILFKILFRIWIWASWDNCKSCSHFHFKAERCHYCFYLHVLWTEVYMLVGYSYLYFVLCDIVSLDNNLFITCILWWTMVNFITEDHVIFF